MMAQMARVVQRGSFFLSLDELEQSNE